MPSEKKAGSALSVKKKSSSGSNECFVCGQIISDPKDENHLEDQTICDSCREQMFSSLEEAWKKHSAFLDSALN